MDIIDQAQARQQQDIDLALAARKTRARGPSHCSNVDCDEPISELRRDLGAELCVSCQADAEQRDRQCAGRGRG
jgi:RNA polymerase-binding transcription factor DksA